MELGYRDELAFKFQMASMTLLDGESGTTSLDGVDDLFVVSVTIPKVNKSLLTV